MEVFNLNDMKKGWFVGDFQPNIISTSNCEVGVKHYKSGSLEDRHYHLEAEELTVVIKGIIRMNDSIFHEGDIILVKKKEIIEFEAIEDAITVVYKSGSFKNDKYIVK